jgi:hypothetical protein
MLCNSVNVLQGHKEHKQTSFGWVLQFKQPASDYVLFRRRLDTNKVALENVMLKNVSGHQMLWRMTGSIKVRYLQ